MFGDVLPNEGFRDERIRVRQPVHPTGTEPLGSRRAMGGALPDDLWVGGNRREIRRECRRAEICRRREERMALDLVRVDSIGQAAGILAGIFLKGA